MDSTELTNFLVLVYFSVISVNRNKLLRTILQHRSQSTFNIGNLLY